MAGSSLEAFLDLVDKIAVTCDTLVERVNKKRDRQTSFNHRRELLAQLSDTEDPPTVLHIVAVC